MEKTEIAGRSARGAIFTVISRTVTIILSLGSQAVLARWLTPADYGLYALGLTALNFLLIFREFGLQSAGIQKQTLSNDEASFLFWCNFLLISCIGLVGVFSSPYVAEFFAEPELRLVLTVMTVAAVVGGFSAQHVMLLRRRMHFGKIAIAEISSLVLGIIAALSVGYVYPDVRALLAMYVVQQSSLSVLTIILCGFIPGAPKKVLDGVEMLKFGLGVTIANLLYFATNNISTILIGYFLKGTALGHFNRAQQLYGLPSSIMSSSVYLVLYGSLSRLLQDPESYKGFYKTALTNVSIIFFILSAFLVVAGDDVIRVLLGPKWDVAGELLRIMAVGLIGVGSAQMTGLLYQSQGRLKQLQFWSVIDGVIRISSILIGSFYGLTGIVVGFALSTTFISSPASIWYAGRQGPVSFADQWKSLIPAFMVFPVVFAGAFLGKSVAFGQDPIMALSAEICCSALFLGVGVWILKPLKIAFSVLFMGLKLSILSRSQ